MHGCPCIYTVGCTFTSCTKSVQKLSKYFLKDCRNNNFILYLFNILIQKKNWYFVLSMTWTYMHIFLDQWSGMLTIYTVRDHHAGVQQITEVIRLATQGSLGPNIFFTWACLKPNNLINVLSFDWLIGIYKNNLTFLLHREWIKKIIAHSAISHYWHVTRFCCY